VLAEAAQKGQQVFYGCKIQAVYGGITEAGRQDGAMLFSNLYRFVPSKIKETNSDLLLVDERATASKKKSNHHTCASRTGRDLPQIEQLIPCCAKTSVFFIDDKQNVRSQEIGTFRF